MTFLSTSTSEFILVHLLGKLQRCHLAGQDKRQQLVEIIHHRS